METKRGILVLTDISGYTRFTRMHFTSLLHAEEIISELLAAVIEAAEFPLQVGQLEGDAVLLFAEVGPGREAEAAHQAVAQVTRLFKAFYLRERALIACDAGCVCDACTQIGQLRLKAVLHFGEFRLEKMGGMHSLGGVDVKLVRSLMKPPISEQEYILMTGRFYALGGGPDGRTPDRRIPAAPDEDALAYFPRVTAPDAVPVPGAGPAFSGRINRHAFARMFGRVPRAAFYNLERGPMNLPIYLLEGIQSGLNLLVRALRSIFPRRSEIELKNAALALVEISADARAADASKVDVEQLVSQVLKAVVEAAPPGLILNKLEGDAAFFFTISKGDSALIARDTARRAAHLHRVFETETAARGASARGLRFKIILHFGQTAFKRIGRFDELGGADVILLHRLLKSDPSLRAAAIMTERFYLLSGGLEGATAQVRSEHAEGLGNAPVRVCALGEE
jgi:hypothetical protein